MVGLDRAALKVATLSSSGKGESFAADLGGIGITGQNIRIDGGITRSV